MAFNISDFKSRLKNGGARPNLFEVQINNPVNTDADALSNFMVKAAQIPGSTIPAIDVPYFGRQVRMAGNRTFEPWTVTILNDEDFSIRNALEEWMGSINGHESGTQLNNQLVYKSRDSYVTHYAKNGKAIATYNFTGIFPTELGAIELAWDSNDQIEEYTVTFAYDFWTHNDVAVR